ncbi:MAG: hypothetical protein HZY79_07805 [Rhodoblastus sp.]|nr:MAG: hypothetical protein HZY79_07805 [Rhodoblastus sp.]
MGMLARLIWPPRPSAAATASFAAACAGVAAGLVWRAPDVWLVALFLAVIVTASRLTGPLADALAARPLVRLGEESYALYLVHVFVFGLVFRAAGALARLGLPGWALTVGAIAAALVAASALHRFVEAPANRLLRPCARRALFI